MSTDDRSLNLVERAWHPVARVDQLGDTALGVRLLGHELVVFRTEQAGVSVLPGRCPHRGTAFAGAPVMGDTIACPYHAWQFDGNGHCTAIPTLPAGPIPSAAHTVAFPAVERSGLVWTSLDTTADPDLIPDFPTPDSVTGVRVITGEPMVWSTSAGRHLENILDLAHFPFVHPDTFGCPEAEVVAAHEVSRTENGIATSVRVTTRNPDTPDGPLYPGLGPVIELGYHYEVELPYRITLRFEFPDGMRRALHEVITPTAPDECSIHWALLVDERLASSDAEELSFARAVFAEDQPIIESQPPGVPIAPTAEVHLPSDRLAVAYRRAFRDAGMPNDALV